MKKTKSGHRRAAEAYTKSDQHHWYRRIAKEMKQSPRVQEYLLRTRRPL